MLKNLNSIIFLPLSIVYGGGGGGRVRKKKE
jgi:hypothetical protein